VELGHGETEPGRRCNLAARRVQAKENKRKQKGFHFLSFIFANPYFSISYQKKIKNLPSP
jgi:hypothetical protein